MMIHLDTAKSELLIALADTANAERHVRVALAELVAWLEHHGGIWCDQCHTKLAVGVCALAEIGGGFLACAECAVEHAKRCEGTFTLFAEMEKP